MFERFSSGYYLGRLYVEPYTGDRAAMHREQHERVNAQLHATDGIGRLDAPLVMKLGSQHFPVHGDRTIPAGTLAIPAAIVENCRLGNPPELAEVLLATAERASQLLRVSGAPSADVGNDP